jgi:uncharacterized membrane protein YkvA (DUF1232 family)
MKASHRRLNELIGREGLTQMSVLELFKGVPLLDLLTEKVNTLDALVFSERELERDVRLLLELLRETFAGRYTRLSVLAFAHILVALDHFVRVKDIKPDTHIGGYTDDLAAICQLKKEFAREIEQFKTWQKRIGDAG